MYRAGTGHVGTGSVAVLMGFGPDTAPEDRRVEGPESNVRGRSGPDTFGVPQESWALREECNLFKEEAQR